MPARNILQLGTPLLWERSNGVHDITAPATRTLIQDLGDTLAGFRATTGWGRGISAPQIGELVRISFIRIDKSLSEESRLSETRKPLPLTEPLLLINPEITYRSTETFMLWDDCFSFPNLMVKVSRHVAIEVDYVDANGKHRHLRALNGLSELLQHEIDHLDGILALDRAIDEHALATRTALEEMNLIPKR